MSKAITSIRIQRLNGLLQALKSGKYMSREELSFCLFMIHYMKTKWEHD
ncbi:MAG: hypothetical protein IJR35_10720 [Synergistaceae bacterium]|nr:hypothetical protein [Synergistaceae bacterium]